MSLQLHEWDIHIVCRGANGASGAGGAAEDDPPRQPGYLPPLRYLAAPLGVGPNQSASSTIRSLPFHERNMMSNKPHLRPHQKKRQASQLTRLLVAILFLTIFALATALAATGRVAPHGRFIP